MRRENDPAVGRRIAQARHELGLTQEELAAELGVTTRSVQGYEAGAVTPFRHLGRLEQITGKSRSWLLYGEDAVDPSTFTERLAELVKQIADDAERIAAAAEKLETAPAQRRRPPASNVRA